MEIFRLKPDLINGIGDKQCKLLSQIGINTIGALIAHAPAFIDQQIDSISEDTIQRWQEMAILLTVKNLTPDIAEILVDAEVNSIEELTESGLRTLEFLVEKAFKAKNMGTPPSLLNLAEIQLSAYLCSSYGIYAGRIISKKSGVGISGVKVKVNRTIQVTSKQGYFFFDTLKLGQHELFILTKSGLLTYSLEITEGGGTTQG